MEKSTPIFVSVTGWSGSGKTTFSENLIAELTSRGHRVSAAKNSHQALQVDKDGSDSQRFFNSGAEAVCLNANNSMTVFRQLPVTQAKELMILFSGSDFIIAEGFKTEKAVRIEVTGLASEPDELKNPVSEADIIVYGNDILIDRIKLLPDLKAEISFIHRNDIRSSADYLTSLLT